MARESGSTTDGDLPLRGQRVLGAHYSPRPVVDDLVAQTLGTLLAEGRFSPGDPPRICDPACGDGVFLASGAAHLAAWLAREQPRASGAWVARRAAGAVHGVDLDPRAVKGARAALRRALAPWDASLGAREVVHQVAWGNSLLTPGDAPRAWRPVSFAAAFPQARPGGRFDVVVGNPPFVDGAELARSAPALRRHLAERYDAAKGNWDLFCVFVERALALLAPGGLLGLILPNKLLSAGYAAAARRLVAAEEVVLLRDYSGVRLFEAAIYPMVLVVRRRGARARRGACRVERASGAPEAPRITAVGRARPVALEETAAAGWAPFFSPAPGTRAPVGRRSTPRPGGGAAATLRPLGAFCEILGAATVAEAYELAPLLEDGAPPPGALRVVNTGTLDPFRSLWGGRALRYLGRRYERPWVDPERLAAALPRRAAQAREPKIIVAGLTRRLECVWDPGRLLAAKSTCLVRLPAASAREREAAMALLALLNGAAASEAYRRQFSGLALGGGYLRVGPPQLRAFPVPDPRALPRARRQALAALGEALHALGEAGAAPDHPGVVEATAALDDLGWVCYGLDRPPEGGHADPGSGDG